MNRISSFLSCGVVRPLAWALALALVGCGGGGTDTPPDAGAGGTARALSATGETADGSATTTATVGVTKIVLRHYTTLADNVGSYIKLRYNGKVIAADEMRQTGLSNYEFRVSQVLDGGTLDVVFTNAAYPNGAEARQYFLESVTINGTQLSSTGPGVVYDVGHNDEAFDGVSALPGRAYLTMTGALRFPVPAKSALGAATAGDSSTLSPGPGIYVDQQGGSDSYTGTFYRPFKTLARAAQVPMLAGENLYLRCNSVWRETLALGVSNMADGTQIVPYGNCTVDPKPVISGGESLNGGWTLSNGVWSRPVPTSLPKIRRMLIGFTPVRTAQWPNAEVAQPKVAAVSAATQIGITSNDASFLAGKDLVGAHIVLRTKPWRIEERVIASAAVASQLINLSTAPELGLEVGVPWVVSDKMWMLDHAGEFFHDVAGGRVYVIAPSNHAGVDLNTLTIEGSVRDIAMDLRERRGLVVRGLTLRMTRGDGLRLTNAPEAVVSGIDSSYNGVAGVRLQQWTALPAGAAGPRIENSTFGSNGELGIDARYVTAAQITGNRVVNTGVEDHVGPVHAGIAAGPGATIDSNVVDASGYSAISFSALDGTVVSNNEVSNYCMRLSDCGAIYTWYGTSQYSARQSATIRDNRIHTAKSPTGSTTTDWGHDLVAGIYLDDFTRGVTVQNNFLHAMPVGMFLHNASNITVQNNRIWMADAVALAISMDRTDGDWSTGNVLQNNEIVPFTRTRGSYPDIPTFQSSHAVWFTHSTAGDAALASGRNEFRANRVTQIHGETAHHARVSGPSGERFIDAAAWQRLNPAEGTILQPMSFNSYWVALGPEKLPGGEFDSGLGAWGRHWSWAAPGYNVLNIASAAGCNGPCVRMTSAVAGDMIFSPEFSMTAGKLHLYRWTASSTGQAATVGWPYIGRSAWPFDEMHDGRGFQGRSTLDVKAGQTNKWEGFFIPKSSDPARASLQLQTQLVPVNLDSVSVREVQMWLASGPSEWVAPVIAARDGARVVNHCGDVGLPADCNVADLDGTAVAFPFTVAANSQRLLLWANSPYRKP